MQKGKQKPFIFCKGLAFAEQAEMDKLSRLSESGWLLERFSSTGLGFILRRGPAHKRIYCLDIQQVSREDENEYREYFAAGGWEFVCSAGGLHIFSAEPGTVPIHTDRTTLYEKYRKITHSSKMVALVVMLITVLTFTMLYLSGHVWDLAVLNKICRVFLIFCAIIFVPSLMVYTAYSLRLRSFSA